MRELNFKGESWVTFTGVATYGMNGVDSRVILRPEYKARLLCKLYLPKVQES